MRNFIKGLGTGQKYLTASVRTKRANIADISPSAKNLQFFFFRQNQTPSAKKTANKT